MAEVPPFGRRRVLVEEGADPGPRVSLPQSDEEKSESTMAIARANRRRIEVEGRKFLWWVYEDLEEEGALTLAVASADKSFLVRYRLLQPDETRHLTVQGRELAGLPESRPSWVRVRCPPFASRDAVRPKEVRELIEWCLLGGAERTQVDWRGSE